MANICLILGKTGTGKSSSIKGLDPKETVIFNVLKKRLPFKGSKSLYNEENKNLFNVDDYATIMNYMQGVDKSAPHVRNIIIESMLHFKFNYCIIVL